VLWIEFIGTITGVLSVWLLARQNWLGWPLGLIYIVLSMVLFFSMRLYGEFLAHVVFLVLSVYGWHQWRAGESGASPLAPQFASTRERLWYGLFMLGAWALCGFLFARLTDNVLPYVDSLIMTMSFVGMWLSAIKKIENWILWLFVNAISIGVYFHQSLYVYALLYVLFFALAVLGFSSWKRSIKVCAL
jgi:nicotinamide mononucleotide transporter